MLVVHLNYDQLFRRQILISSGMIVVGTGVSVGAATGNLLAAFSASAAAAGGVGFITNTAWRIAAYLDPERPRPNLSTEGPKSAPLSRPDIP